jgi:hypothetical protein
MSAAQAEPQVHPAIAGLNAVFTYMLFRAGDFDLIEVSAAIGHKNSVQEEFVIGDL